MTNSDEGQVLKAFRFGKLYAYAAAGCCFLFAAGFLRRRHRALLYAIRKHFQSTAPAPRPPALLPKTELPELFRRDRDVTLLEPGSVDGNVSLLELASIAHLIRRVQPRQIFEIGTFDGRTSINMIANAPAGCHLFTLDLPSAEAAKTQFAVEAFDVKYIQKSGSGARFRGTEFEKSITQLLGDSAAFDYKDFTGRMDVVFVDGSHAYEYVKSDTEVALRLLKPGGGLILWHDYDTEWWPGVTRALNELFAERKELRGMQHVNGTALAYAFVK